MGAGRQLLVDTLGLLLKVVVHPANLHDRLGAKLVLVETLDDDFPRLQHIWADQGYAGALRQWAAAHLGIDLEVVYPWWRQLQRYMPDLLAEMGFQPGFHVLPRRSRRRADDRLAGALAPPEQGRRTSACQHRGACLPDVHSAAPRPLGLKTGANTKFGSVLVVWSWPIRRPCFPLSRVGHGA